MQLYVSKLGSHTDGRSWATAFNTVQAALDAVPDDRGGHRIAVRPDTYVEANLHPAQRGAAGAYNELVADFDGSLGSGTRGYAIIDASDPEKGLQSIDWWGVPRCTPEFSGVDWDRWRLGHLYATGGDGGLFWDLPFRIEPFAITVEDCVGIGRAFGGGVAHVLPRPGEPSLFRRCHLWSLDWWGDAAGAYVRAENAAMPDQPDVVFEDCVLVGPQCSLKSGNPGFASYSRVRVRGCRLITLNFSQPHGTPTEGIIQSVVAGQFLHVDLEDTLLMGYKVFGVRQEKQTLDRLRYTVGGSVRAYVQFQQAVPPGMQGLGSWPAADFGALVPPAPLRPPSPLVRDAWVRDDLCELTPVWWQGRLCHLECVRPAEGGRAEEYYLRLTEAEGGAELARFAQGYGLASALEHDGVFHAFASRWQDGTWNDVTHFWSTDLEHWQRAVVIHQDPDEHLFNSSVCASPRGFALAYETNDPAYPAFSVKYATSADLHTWEPLAGVVFGTNRYTACPCLRWADGYYYQLYLEHRRPRWHFETYISRSPDLRHWELSPANPVLAPEGLDEGTNASDPELIEVDGATWLYYAVGDQRTWMKVKRARAAGSLAAFLSHWFESGAIPDPAVAGPA